MTDRFVPSTEEQNERYLDALFDDHDKGHPGRETPVLTCEFCLDPGLFWTEHTSRYATVKDIPFEIVELKEIGD